MCIFLESRNKNISINPCLHIITPKKDDEFIILDKQNHPGHSDLLMDMENRSVYFSNAYQRYFIFEAKLATILERDFHGKLIKADLCMGSFDDDRGIFLLPVPKEESQFSKSLAEAVVKAKSNAIRRTSDNKDIFEFEVSRDTFPTDWPDPEQFVIDLGRDLDNYLVSDTLHPVYEELAMSKPY